LTNSLLRGMFLTTPAGPPHYPTPPKRKQHNTLTQQHHYLTTQHPTHHTNTTNTINTTHTHLQHTFNTQPCLGLRNVNLKSRPKYIPKFLLSTLKYKY